MRKIVRLLTGVVLLVLTLGLAVPSMAQTTASPYTTGLRYDVLDRVIGQISPDPDANGPLNFPAVRNTYDISGHLVRVEEGWLAAWASEVVPPSAWTGFTVHLTTETTYDALDRKLVVKRMDSNGDVQAVTQYSYNLVDRSQCTAVRMNLAPSVLATLPASACTHTTAGLQGPDRITKEIYDPEGQLIQVRKALGTPLEQAYATYTHLPSGRIATVIDAKGNRAKLEYDGFDRQVKWLFPSKVGPSSFNPATPTTALASAGEVNNVDYEQYGYDVSDNRTTLRKRDGSTILYQYDPLNRLSVKTLPERINLPGTHTRDVYYSYDGRGLMTTARFDSRAGEGVTIVYDGAGRATSSTISMDGVDRALTYVYDADGNRTRVTYPDSNYVTYDYDGLDRPRTITGSPPSWLASYGYDQEGELISQNVGPIGTTFDRDAIGRISSSTRDLAGAGFDLTTNFNYNPASQITLESHSNDLYAFTGQGDINRSFISNGLNQYSSVSAISHCYDDNGNLTADGTYVYLYDVENRLVEQRAKVNGACPLSASDYAGALEVRVRYDSLGRLYETVGTATGSTRFLMDGDVVAAEYNDTGSMLRRYVHAGRQADDPIIWYEGASVSNANVRFLSSNQQGSITVVADNDGNVSRLFRFDEYGMPEAADGAQLTPANGARFLYTGQAWMPDLGMYYYKARIYSPVLGRFLQVDPIGYDDQINLYAYVANDPVNDTDPEGLASAGGCVGGTPGTEQFCTPSSKGNCDSNCRNELAKKKPVTPRPRRIEEPFDATKLREECLAESGKVVGVGLGLLGLGQPVLPAGTKLGNATPGTSPASVFFRKLFPQRIKPVGIPTLKNPNAKTRTLGGVLGRLTPYVGSFIAGAGATSGGACVSAGMSAQYGIAQPMGF